MRTFAPFVAALLGIGLATAAPAADSNNDDPAYDSVLTVSEEATTQTPLEIPASADCGGCADECIASCRTCRACGPCWTVTSDALFLDRTSADYSFITDSPVNVVERTRQFAPQTGWQIDAVRSLSNGRELELRYLRMDNWSSLIEYHNLLGGGDVRYSAELQGTEANLRWSTRPNVTWLLGVRWAQLSEEFNTQPPGISAFHDVHTVNDLYGVQVGADLDIYNRGGPLRVDADLLIGVYDNQVNRFEREDAFPAPVATHTRFHHTSIVGEINVTASYQLSERLALRAGYELLWLDGVALASNNFLDSPNATANGTLFCHGATAGIEFAW
jgi:hypothetical protein